MRALVMVCNKVARSAVAVVSAPARICITDSVTRSDSVRPWDMNEESMS